MNNPNIESEATYEPASHEALLSLGAELAERLEDCYAQAEFLEEASAAVQEHLHCDSYSSGPGDEDDTMSGSGYVNDDANNQHYYDEDIESGDVDTEYCDDFEEEQCEDDEEAYGDWDGDNEYYD